MHGHAVRGREFEDALEEGLRQRAELEAQVLFERFAIELTGVGGVLQDAFDFGREDELAVLLRVVKRFDAEEIARAEELARRSVPDGEREHAAQAVEHAFAPCEIAREQHFRIGFRLELPALRLEFGAKVLVVVDFPVEHDGEIARSMSERRRCPSAMPLSTSRYWPSPSGPRWAMMSHMALSAGMSALVAWVNPQIPHMQKLLHIDVVRLRAAILVWVGFHDSESA